MSISYKDVRVDRLVIDHAANPRHDPLPDEPAAVAQIFRSQKVLPLAKHIAQFGLNPLQRLAVIEHPHLPKYYVSLEGNRRVCALKLLRDPDRAPDPGGKREMAAIAKAAVTLPAEIPVALFSDRASAREWLKITHRRSKSGVGTLHWGPTQDVRFDAQDPTSVSNPNAQAVALLDFAEADGMLEAENRLKISPTTMTRYLSTPAVRAALGLDNNRDVMRIAPQEEFKRAVARFLRDLLPQGGAEAVLTSRTHKNAKGRKDYAEQLGLDGDGVTTRLPAAELATPGPSRAAAKRARSSRHPNDRPYVVPVEFKLVAKNPILRRIFDELKRVDPEPDGFPFSANYLLRAFIEQVVVLYAKKHNAGHNGDLHVVVGRCADHLEKLGVEKNLLKPLRTHASEQHHFTSVHTLGAQVHGNGVPKDATMKAAWDSLEPALSEMIKRL